MRYNLRVKNLLIKFELSFHRLGISHFLSLLNWCRHSGKPVNLPTRLYGVISFTGTPTSILYQEYITFLKKNTVIHYIFTRFYFLLQKAQKVKDSKSSPKSPLNLLEILFCLFSTFTSKPIQSF